MEKKGSQKRVNIWAGPRITENMTGKSKCINRERKKKSELGESRDCGQRVGCGGSHSDPRYDKNMAMEVDYKIVRPSELKKSRVWSVKRVTLMYTGII